MKQVPLSNLVQIYGNMLENDHTWQNNIVEPELACNQV